MQEFIDRIGKAAQQSAADAKLRLAVRTANGKLDERAQALGHLMFRRQEGEAVSEEEMLKLLKEMAQLKAEKAAREAELAALHQPAAAEPATPAEPESTPEASPVLEPAGSAEEPAIQEPSAQESPA